jgi:hypothetical protein
VYGPLWPTTLWHPPQNGRRWSPVCQPDASGTNGGRGLATCCAARFDGDHKILGLPE